MRERLNVTKTFLPPLEEYTALVKRAWDSQWLTNRGQLVIELEDKLKQLLGVRNILIMNNGTVPMQIALKLLGKAGEVITTPFSYVATTSSIVWEQCRPVFVDIDPVHLTIDESRIEQAITPATTAILATHVFGNPCNVHKIEDIASRHGLKVIYDAAHAFGVNYHGKSIFDYGDVSTCSFHATKLFHTGEGGAVFCKDDQLMGQIFYSHNFGHNGPLDFHGLGINGKISELQAAMGLAVLPYFDKILSGRKRAVEFYNANLRFDLMQKISIRENTEWNYSYYPVIFDSESVLLKAEKALQNENIFPRRYFYPSLNTISYTGNSVMKQSESISPRIMCLPLNAEMSEEILDVIVNTVNKCI
jgi:dTDP-4-amino-4,6-dideoxygalactose transaminase